MNYYYNITKDGKKLLEQLNMQSIKSERKQNLFSLIHQPYNMGNEAASTTYQLKNSVK